MLRLYLTPAGLYCEIEVVCRISVAGRDFFAWGTLFLVWTIVFARRGTGGCARGLRGTGHSHLLRGPVRILHLGFEASGQKIELEYFVENGQTLTWVSPLW